MNVRIEQRQFILVSLEDCAAKQDQLYSEVQDHAPFSCCKHKLFFC